MHPIAERKPSLTEIARSHQPPLFLFQSPPKNPSVPPLPTEAKLQLRPAPLFRGAGLSSAQIRYGLPNVVQNTAPVTHHEATASPPNSLFTHSSQMSWVHFNGRSGKKRISRHNIFISAFEAIARETKTRQVPGYRAPNHPICFVLLSLLSKFRFRFVASLLGLRLWTMGKVWYTPWMRAAWRASFRKKEHRVRRKVRRRPSRIGDLI
jgi:hypothetical protein